MGGNNSVTDSRRQVRGGIFIQLERTGYISKDTIQGLLHINLEEQFKGHLLKITLEGKEEVYYHFTRTSGRNRQKVFVQGINPIISFSLPIYDFAPQNNSNNFILQPVYKYNLIKDKIYQILKFYQFIANKTANNYILNYKLKTILLIQQKQGQWTIPFSMYIADTLPSTMSYIKLDDNETRCNLTYALRADIISMDPNVRPVSGIQDVFIGQQSNIMPQQLSKQLLSSPKRTCCCCLSQGDFKLQASTDKYCYGPNEVITVTLNCDFSRYSKNILSLNVSLGGKLIMKSPQVQQIHQSESYKQLLVCEVQNKKAEQTVQLTVPGHIPLTTNGILIDLQYYIIIAPNIDMCCVYKNNPLLLQIMVNPTRQLQNINIPNQQQMQAPLNWRPIQLLQGNFSEQQAYEIQQQLLNQREQQNQIQINQVYLPQADQQANFQSNNQQNMNDLNKPLL